MAFVKFKGKYQFDWYEIKAPDGQITTYSRISVASAARLSAKGYSVKKLR